VNQDWDAYGKAPEDAVRAYVRDVTAAERAATAQEVARLLGTARTERALDRALDALRCGYAPGAHGKTARAWLGEVAALLA
jgi:hypothetical protein